MSAWFLDNELSTCYSPGMNSTVFEKCESCLTCATVQGQERK